MHGEHSKPLCDQHWQVSTWFTSRLCQLMNNARAFLPLLSINTSLQHVGGVINQRKPLDDGAIRRAGRQWYTTLKWWIFIAQPSGATTSITCFSSFEEKILLYDGEKTLAVESSRNQSLLWNLNSMKDYLSCNAEKDGIMQKTKERKAAPSGLWCGATFGESSSISFDTCNEIYSSSFLPNEV